MLAAKAMRFPIDIILVCIRWYAAYPLSYRHLEEMMQERGLEAACRWNARIWCSRIRQKGQGR
jgi:transposase-like protein